jgi:hypothetical protein
VLKLDFVGANPTVTPHGQDLTQAKISYFKGPREQWQTGLPTYRSIAYPDLWPGIDLVYSGTTNRLKYTFVVKPGADPQQIKLAYRGASAVTLTDGGQLHVTTPLGGFTDDAPYAYQERNGQRVAVAAAYALEKDTAVDTQVHGFHVGPYDTSQELILDPAVVVYAGFIGGRGNDVGTGIAIDGDGNAYITGSTTPTEAAFPVLVGPDLTFNGFVDAFVAKVTADGTGLLYAGYIGGSGNDSGNGIAVDTDGNAYVTGETNSTEATFPVVGGPDLTHNGGNLDAFVAKVTADGTSLLYAGYIGGSGQDSGFGIAVDADGNAYITGLTGLGSTEATFPVVGGPDLTYNGGVYDAFVAKVKADGTGLLYAGYIGGSGEDQGTSIAVDTDGNAYVTGFTTSTEATFPVLVGPNLIQNGGQDAFVAKVNADGTGLLYAGYIGGSGEDSGNGIAVDTDGNAYVTGETNSTEATFPVLVGPDLTFNGFVDAFVAKVTADGTGLLYAGYIGGSGEDQGTSIAVDTDGNAYVTGFTTSTEGTFPVVDDPDLTHNGGQDAFVAKVNADGTGLTYAGYIGGSGDDLGFGIAVDTDGNAYVTGYTTSTEGTFPVVGGPDLTFNGFGDAFVAKVDSTATPSPLEVTLFPTSRAVPVGTLAIALATVRNTGNVPATDVGITLPAGLSVPLGLLYQTLDATGTVLTGTLNTPVTIPPGGTQNFVLGLLPPSPILQPARVPFLFAGTNTLPAPIVQGGNTLLLTAESTPPPDPVAIAVTCASDDGQENVVNLPGLFGLSAFAVAALNLGAPGQVAVIPTTGEFALPVNLFICQFDPQTGCMALPAGQVSLAMDTGEVAFFAVLVQGRQQEIALERRTHRVLVQFFDASNVARGEVSVPVRTHTPACAS